MLAAYGSFLLAEELHVSGVLATLAAGMLVGNWGKGRKLTEEGGKAVVRFGISRLFSPIRWSFC
jgi:CPA1 family monovalent cation:H+ antiporter